MKIVKEIWRPAVGYEKLIKVSTLGRVKSIERVVDFGRQKRLVKSKILKPKDNGKGYKIVRAGKKYPYIHRLVALTFIPNPNNLPEIDHLNCCKSDNRLCNLRWVNRKMNMNNPITLSRHKRKKEKAA